MRLICFIFILSFNGAASAVPKSVENFVPGKYSLAQGTPENCSDGEFEVADDGKRVQLGSHHGFSTITGSTILKSDMPEEAGCNYDVRNVKKISGKQTILAFQETVRCPGKIRHVLKRTAKLSAKRVEILVDQKANPELRGEEESFKYSCVFVKK